MKVTISGNDGLPEMVSTIGIRTHDRRRAMDVIRYRQDEFLRRQAEIHGAAR